MEFRTTTGGVAPTEEAPAPGGRKTTLEGLEDATGNGVKALATETTGGGRGGFAGGGVTPVGTPGVSPNRTVSWRTGGVLGKITWAGLSFTGSFTVTGTTALGGRVIRMVSGEGFAGEGGGKGEFSDMGTFQFPLFFTR